MFALSQQNFMGCSPHCSCRRRQLPLNKVALDRLDGKKRNQISKMMHPEQSPDLFEQTQCRRRRPQVLSHECKNPVKSHRLAAAFMQIAARAILRFCERNFNLQIFPCARGTSLA
jgi:hypothetical protein